MKNLISQQDWIINLATTKPQPLYASKLNVANFYL